MIPPKDDKVPLPASYEDSEAITEADVEQMKQIFEEAKRVVKPIVKRESAAEVVSVELLNIRLRDACRT